MFTHPLDTVSKVFTGVQKMVGCLLSTKLSVYIFVVWKVFLSLPLDQLFDTVGGDIPAGGGDKQARVPGRGEF